MVKISPEAITTVVVSSALFGLGFCAYQIKKIADTNAMMASDLVSIGDMLDHHIDASEKRFTQFMAMDS